jgi:hypothetical protein
LLEKEDMMTTNQQFEQFSYWARQRSDEIEATLREMRQGLGALGAEAKSQAEKAIAEMSAQRDVFQKALKEQRAETEAVLAKGRNTLEANWASFETTVQKYLADARQTAEHQQALFAARADAQRRAWQHSIEAFYMQAGSFAAAKRTDLDVVLDHAKAEAETAKSRLEASAKAGAHSWDAMKTALEESRAAFEKAGKKVQDAFKQVG